MIKEAGINIVESIKDKSHPMKKVTLTSLIFILTTILYGQQVEFNVAPTINNSLYFKSVDGGAGRNIKPGVSTSLAFTFNNDKKINLGIGLCYQFGQVEYTPNMNTGNFIGQTDKVYLISVNIISRYNLKKNFYLSLIPLIDLHINYGTESIIDNQSGLGLSLSFGKHLRLNEKILLNIEPRLWIHNIIPLYKQPLTEKLTVAGLNVGLVFGHKNEILPNNK